MNVDFENILVSQFEDKNYVHRTQRTNSFAGDVFYWDGLWDYYFTPRADRCKIIVSQSDNQLRSWNFVYVNKNFIQKFFKTMIQTLRAIMGREYTLIHILAYFLQLIFNSAEGVVKILLFITSTQLFFNYYVCILDFQI